MKRVLTALLLIPLILFINFRAPAPLVGAVLVLVALLCLSEVYEIAERMSMRPLRIFGYGAGAVLVLARGIPEGAYFVALSAILLLLSLKRVQSLHVIFGSVASTLFALIYVCGPFALARDLHGVTPHWLFVVLLMNWVGDSAAYYGGRTFGRRRLAPRLSPNKTWEGAIASTLTAVPAGVGYLMYFQPSAVLPAAALMISLTINLAAQLGDLAESALKRGAGIKDSGDLLPGHGGMLDRVDGLLFSFPACYFLVIGLA